MKTIKIGTRESDLALIQAQKVQNFFSLIDLPTELVLIKSLGDFNLNEPLHKFNQIGIFTNTLNNAILNNEIDLAVHSYKDLPTKIHDDLIVSAILKRDNPFDILITLNKNIGENDVKTLATGSLRRKFNWEKKYPYSNIVGLRGNIKSRLSKLNNEENIDGIIMSYAAVLRLNINDYFYSILKWMIPAPAQGTICVVSKKSNIKLNKILTGLNDKKTEICTTIERDFMSTLEAGCSFPLGAYASIEKNKIVFNGNIFKNNFEFKISEIKNENDYLNFGKDCAYKVLNEITLFSNQFEPKFVK